MTSTPPPEGTSRSVVDGVRSALEALSGLESDLSSVLNGDLAALAAQASALVAAAEAVRAAVVVEASTRGVIAESDYPRVQRWVEQSCREGGVPVVRAQSRQLHEVAATCTQYDVRALREAVVTGSVPLESAALVAKTFRRMRVQTDCPDWRGLMDTLLTLAAKGGGPREFAIVEDLTLGQHGTGGALDLEHERLRVRRELTGFRRDRSGMLAATLRLDRACQMVCVRGRS